MGNLCGEVVYVCSLAIKVLLNEWEYLHVSCASWHGVARLINKSVVFQAFASLFDEWNIADREYRNE